MAIVSPNDRYSRATFQPNIANSMPSATSFTIGAEIRKEKVTPSGTPAETNPMNSGTAEQEQNGVTMTSDAASTLPTPSPRRVSSARVRSGENHVRTIPMPKETPVK